MSSNFVPKGKRVKVGEYTVRSMLEARVMLDLMDKDVSFTYERKKIKYMPPPPKMKSYTPDLVLDNGIIIEVKGLFTAKDRKKHLLILEQHPELDIRFIFSKPHTYITASKKKTYAEWCEHYGFKWAEDFIPNSWISEKPCV